MEGVDHGSPARILPAKLYKLCHLMSANLNFTSEEASFSIFS